jgi:hypothetical protein
MQNAKRYPELKLQSKNELAKRLSTSKFTKDEAQKLINDVSSNHEKYYRDSKYSEPEKGKYVRNAKGTPLGGLLKRINEQVLAPSDNLLPSFLFGGIQNMNHLMAAEHLLGEKRQRTLLALDISKFFETVSGNRVRSFFRDKCGCTDRAALLISNICCVPEGPKNSGSINKTLGRGFATSSRLAIWCNLDTFIALDRLVQRRLKGYNPRLAIYVDDIGITASRVPKEKMEALADEIAKLLATFDANQPLPENRKKRKIITHEQGMIHLGVSLQKNKLLIGPKTRSKLIRAKTQYEKLPAASPERGKLRKKYKAIRQYKSQVESIKR